MSYFDKLEQLLEEYDWKPNAHTMTTNMRKGHYSVSVGHTCHWTKPGKPFLPSQLMKKDPRIYNECKRLFPDFDFKMCIINKNFTSPPHKDTNNTQKSLIIGLGDYNGGDLSIKDHKTGEITSHCIYKSPLYFDGKSNTHWTEPYEGTRYAVILGNSKFNAHVKADDYIVAIPSYQRAETLRDKSLRILQEQQINPDCIYIFVANEEQKAEYEAVLPKYYREIVVGVVGLNNIRNFITDYFDEGTKMFCMDDDISNILELTQEGQTSRVQEGIPQYQGHFWDKPLLHKLIHKGFDECKRKGAKLWGIYPACNLFPMKLRTTYDLRFIIGSFYGCINSKLKVETDDKDDYERTILYYKQDNCVIRFWNISVKSNYYNEKGGAQVTRTKERVAEGALFVSKKYPEYCSINMNKEYADLKLYSNPKKLK